MRYILVFAAVFVVFLSPSAIIAKAQSDSETDKPQDDADDKKEDKEETTEPSDSSEATPPADDSEAAPPAVDSEAAPSEPETPQDTPSETTDQPANDESSSVVTSTPSSEVKEDQDTGQDESVIAPKKEAPVVSESTQPQKDSQQVDAEQLELADYSSVDTSEYGGRFTLGIAIGGGGIAGIPIRIFFAQLFALELGVYYRPVIVIGGDSDPGGPMFAGGFDIYFNKRYSRSRIKLNGIFIKGGYSLSKIVHSEFAALGWAHERMRVGNRSYSFSIELGTGLIFNQLKRDDVEMNDIGFLLYWKFHWGWALGTGFN